MSGVAPIQQADGGLKCGYVKGASYEVALTPIADLHPKSYYSPERVSLS